jgi:hypothetical protein
LYKPFANLKIKAILPEIILITIAGSITILLSIHSLLKSEKQEQELKETQKELKQKQDFIIRLQKEISENAKEMNALQKQLYQDSKSQLLDMQRLKHPVPESFKVLLEAEIVMTTQEIEELVAAVQAQRGLKGNQLPVDLPNMSSAGVNKMNLFKDIGLEMNIIFTKGDKNMRVRLKRIPMQFSGYHSPSLGNNNFILFYNAGDSPLRIKLNGLFLQTNEIAFNYASPSMVDFDEGEVIVRYQFFFPKMMMMGSLSTKQYLGEKNVVLLKLCKLRLDSNNFNIELKDIQTTTEPDVYKARYKVG